MDVGYRRGRKRASGELTDHAVREPSIGFPLSKNRITSYNVCYTKLLREEKTTFIVASHDPTLIEGADRMVKIVDGLVSA